MRSVGNTPGLRPPRCLGWGWVLVLAACPVSAGAQSMETRSDDGLTIYRLSVHARSPRPPVMRHRLLPAWSETRDANAAPQYHRAILLISQTTAHLPQPNELWEKLDTWRTMPLGELPLDDVERTVASFSHALQEAHHGARRRFCRWDLPIEEQQRELFSILLPEIQEIRAIARILAVRIRLRLARGDVDTALTDLQTGYAMARHVAEENFVVSGLVGLAVASLMHQQLLTAMTLDDAPNLYWSLTNLPNPLIDIRSSLEVERDSIFAMFPELKEARVAQFPEEAWNDRLHQVSDRVRQYANKSDSWKQALEGLALFGQVDVIRQRLSERTGTPIEEIRAMPASRAILWYSGLAYEEQRDEAYRAVGLPYHEAVAIYQQDQARRDSDSSASIDPLKLAATFLPACQQFHRSMALQQRWIELLRIIEAVRDHAQAHGQLPDALDDVTSLPVPMNPISGASFLYSRNGDSPDQFTLETHDAAPGNAQLRLHIEMRYHE
jgi:hypothetical protein